MPIMLPDANPLGGAYEFLLGTYDPPVPQGDDGRDIEEQIRHVALLWINRTGSLATQVPEDMDAADVSYNPIPPRRTSHVRARIVFRGKGKPRPFNYDLD